MGIFLVIMSNLIVLIVAWFAGAWMTAIRFVRVWRSSPTSRQWLVSIMETGDISEFMRGRG